MAPNCNISSTFGDVGRMINPEFKCDKCGKEFYSNAGLEVHREAFGH